MDKMIKALAKDAKKHGICKEWHSRLKLMSPDDKRGLVQMYLDGIDFCLNNNYPSNDFIKRYFSDVAVEMGVFVDKDISVENSPKCVCLGTTCGIIKTSDFAVCEIFAKHEAELNVTASGDSFIVIDVFDNAVVNIHTFDRAKVCVNRYGGIINEIFTEKTSCFKIREKHKNKY